MTAMEVREIKESEYRLWDELVERSPQGTIFHKSFWLTSSRDIFNKKLKIFASFKEDNITSGCPLFINKSGFLEFATSAAEMTPYGGIVLENLSTSKVREKESVYDDFVESLCNKFNDLRIPYIKLINSPNLVDIRPFLQRGWEGKVLYAYYFDLNGNIEDRISKKTRNIIRKGIKSELSIKESWDYEIFYDLLSMTFERKGLRTPATKSYVKRQIELVESKCAGKMWMAETSSGLPAAAEIFLWDDKCAYRWSAASDPNYRDTGATSLLLYKIFGYLKEKDYKEVNLMAAITPSLTKFISGFNPKLVPYYSVERKTILGRIGEMVYLGLKRHKA